MTMRVLQPGEQIKEGDRLMLNDGARVTVRTIRSDGLLVVTGRGRSWGTIPLENVWKKDSTR